MRASQMPGTSPPEATQGAEGRIPKMRAVVVTPGMGMGEFIAAVVPLPETLPLEATQDAKLRIL
jgi:hypothetical protein